MVNALGPTLAAEGPVGAPAYVYSARSGRLFFVTFVNALVVQLADVFVDTELFKPSLLVLSLVLTIHYLTPTLARQALPDLALIVGFNLSVYLSLLVTPNLSRSLWAGLSLQFRLSFFLLAFVYFASGRSLERFQRLAAVVAVVSMLIAAHWFAVRVTTGRLPYNFENQGSAILVAVSPFLFYANKRILYWLSVVCLLILGSRMGLLMLAVTLYSSMGLKQRAKERQAFLIATILVLVIGATFVLITNFNLIAGTIRTYIPEAPPDRPIQDWRRITNNYFSVTTLRENWLSGIGIGIYQTAFYEQYRLWAIPHGFVQQFWLQCGLVNFVLFCTITWRSIRQCVTSKHHIARAALVSNVVSFLYFFSRPQQGNFIYFAVLAMGLALPYLDSPLVRSNDESAAPIAASTARSS